MGKQVSLVYGSIHMSNMQKKVYCEVNNSKHVLRFLRILRRNALIYGYSKVAKSSKILVYLRYSRNRPTLKGMVIKSKSGHRRFINLRISKKNISNYKPGSNIISSTSQNKEFINTYVDKIYSQHKIEKQSFGEFICLTW